MASEQWNIRMGAVGAGALLALLFGCDPNTINHLTEERAGNITVLVINNTTSRAGLSFGSWDSLDRDPPAPMTLQQLRIEPLTSAPVATIACRRNVAIGTDGLIQRALDTDVDDSPVVAAELLVTVVNFSDAPTGSDGADLPTAGTAKGREVLLGIDFSCGDQLIFTLVEDPSDPRGFRIDYSVLVDEEDDG